MIIDPATGQPFEGNVIPEGRLDPAGRRAHQTQMHNLITLTNYQTRLALHAEAARNKTSGQAR